MGGLGMNMGTDWAEQERIDEALRRARAARTQRAITGNETQGDIADNVEAKRAGAQWLTAGASGSANIAQQGMIEQTAANKIPASMAELRVKVESDQQIEDTKETGLNGRTQMTEEGASFREGMRGQNQLANTELEGANRLGVQNIATGGQLEAAKLGLAGDKFSAQSAAGASMYGADRALEGVQAKTAGQAEVAKIKAESESVWRSRLAALNLDATTMEGLLDAGTAAMRNLDPYASPEVANAERERIFAAMMRMAKRGGGYAAGQPQAGTGPNPSGVGPLSLTPQGR